MPDERTAQQILSEIEQLVAQIKRQLEDVKDSTSTAVQGALKDVLAKFP